MRGETKIRLVVFDWAGTTIDHGSRAPTMPFVRAFAGKGVVVTPDEARGPMGVHKRDHIRALLQLPRVAQRWRERHGRDATETDVTELFDLFVPLQMEVIGDFTKLTPGVLECVKQIRQRGIRIGATTGYFKEAAERVYAAAAAQGYEPDCCMCAEDVPVGRPAPWMIFRIMETLDIYPPASVLKIGDTVPDIEEGRAAGAWSIGVMRSSSEVGCTEGEWNLLPPADQAKKIGACREKLLTAGAHAVVETLADLPELVTEIEKGKLSLQ